MLTKQQAQINSGFSQGRRLVRDGARVGTQVCRLKLASTEWFSARGCFAPTRGTRVAVAGGRDHRHPSSAQRPEALRISPLPRTGPRQRRICPQTSATPRWGKPAPDSVDSVEKQVTNQNASLRGRGAEGSLRGLGAILSLGPRCASGLPV